MSRSIGRFHPIDDGYLRTIICRFLLVSLNIEAILGEVTIHQRRKKLQKMARGNGLSDAYTATLRRLKAQKGDKSLLGLKVLMWVLYSERPLRAEELCHALGVEIGSVDLDPKNVPVLRTLQSSCLGLMTVETSSSTVRLVHFTLQEHLLNNPTLFHSPHTTIAEVCLTYLNFESVWDLRPTLHLAPSTMPLLEYASYYWGDHTRMAVTQNVKMLALRLLNRFEEHISAQLLLLHYNKNRGSGPYFPTEEGPMGFTGLHGVSFLGIVEMVAPTLEMREWDVNATDCMGSTALTWAAWKGHEEIVKILLEREDVNPNQADTVYGQTPLSWAAECGHEEVVKMLLEQEGVELDRGDTVFGQSPLLWAAQHGHEGVVKMLLEREGVNPDRASTKYGRTPLWWAARNGHEEVVKMLLEREEVDPDQADTEYGQTPLTWATQNGHEGVIKMLLEREDVNPDLADTKYGRTPLSWAAQNGHEGVAKTLLKREDVNPDREDTKYGQTPLSRAAEYGHEGVVKMLLEREDVNPDQADTEYSQTPLKWAARNGHDRVVMTLLERQDVHATTLDNKNQTPLSLPFSERHHEAVRILRENANLNTTVPGGQVSLPPPAGHEDGCLVDMQSRSHNPDVNITDLNAQPAPPLTHPNELEVVLYLKGPARNSADSDLSLNEPSALPQPPSIPPLKLLYLPTKTDTSPNGTRPTLPLTLSWYFLVAFFICLLAFLVYAPLPPLPHIFSFYR